jgi:hypothetical protein
MVKQLCHNGYYMNEVVVPKSHLVLLQILLHTFVIEGSVKG